MLALRIIYITAALSIILGAATICAVRQRAKERISISEISLFFITCAALSLLNSYGGILQDYLSNLLHWNSYNLKDLLTGTSNAVLPQNEGDLILSAWPIAAICCSLALLFAHFQTQPVKFILVFSLAFLLLAAAGDLVLGGKNPPLLTAWLADALGAPILWFIACGIYFRIARTAAQVEPIGVRPVLIIALGLSVMLISSAVIFLLEKLFLAPLPTFIEAELAPLGTTSLFLTLPKTTPLSHYNGLDALSTEHPVE